MASTFVAGQFYKDLRAISLLIPYANPHRKVKGTLFPSDQLFQLVECTQESAAACIWDSLYRVVCLVSSFMIPSKKTGWQVLPSSAGILSMLVTLFVSCSDLDHLERYPWQLYKNPLRRVSSLNIIIKGIPQFYLPYSCVSVMWMYPHVVSFLDGPVQWLLFVILLNITTYCFLLSLYFSISIPCCVFIIYYIKNVLA